MFDSRIVTIIWILVNAWFMTGSTTPSGIWFCFGLAVLWTLNLWRLNYKRMALAKVTQ